MTSLRLCLLLAVALTAATAQVSSRSGALSGRVMDASGAVVPGAKVSLRNTATNRTRELTTDAEGVFRAPELDPGNYEVVVRMTGFAEYRSWGVIVALGQAPQIEIHLTLPTTESAVTVSGSSGALEPTQVAMQTNVETERIEELPVHSRNYLDFVLLAPGVTPVGGPAAGAGGQSADSGFVFGGLRPRSNNITMDGVDNNDEYTGASRTELSLEAVREFQVVNSGIAAESGGAAGGTINVLSRSGSNYHHGDAFVFVENGALDARPPLEHQPAKPDLTRYRVGGALGGPIVRSRTFYYGAAEQEHLRTADASDIDRSLLASINAFLASGRYPALHTQRLAIGNVPSARAETEASFRLDHQVTGVHSMMVRYAYTNVREAGDAFNTSAFVDSSTRGSAFTKDHAAVAALTSLLSNSAVNDARLQLATRRAVLRTTDQVGPQVEIVGAATFGRAYDGNGSRLENHYEFADSLTLVRGPHLLKVGGVLRHVTLAAATPDGFGGAFLFATPADFFAGTPAYYRQAFGNPTTDFGTTAYGGYLQDHWTAAKHINIDLGVRYDFAQLPDLFHANRNNFSPRLGVAWQPSDRWVVRTGFGIFYDRYVLAFLNRALQKDGVQAFEQVAHGPAAALIWQQLASGSRSGPFPGLAPSIFAPQAGMPTPYSETANLGVERLVTRNLTAKANLLFTRGVKLPRTVNVNLAPPAVLSLQNAASLGVPVPEPQQLGRPVFGPRRLDPRFDSVYQLQDRAASRYHGLALTLNRRFVGDSAFSASYTYSKSYDDASDFDEQPQDPYDLRAERSLSRHDQRHRFVCNALFEIAPEDHRDPDRAGPWYGKLVNNWEAGPIVTLGSGVRADPLTGSDSNQAGAWPLSSRPLGAARSSLRTPATANVDVRLLHFITFREHDRLDLVVESFNLLNHRNVAQVSPAWGTGQQALATFGSPTSVLNARQIRFSLDYEF